MIDFQALAKEAHALSTRLGFWGVERSPEFMACLIHGEITDAFREWRKWGSGNMMYYKLLSEHGPTTSQITSVDGWLETTPDWKAYGLAIELADVVILLADWAGRLQVCIESREVHGGSFPPYAFSELHDAANALDSNEDKGESISRVVRVMMYADCGMNIPLAEAIRVKMAWNKTQIEWYGGK